MVFPQKQSHRSDSVGLRFICIFLSASVVHPWCCLLYTSGIRPEYQAAVNFIQTRHFAEALQALSGVPMAERDANWYALSAMANSGAGNRVQALADARRAAEMDPTNPDFQRLLHQLESGGDAYATYSAGYPNSGFGTGSWCADMCLLNLCCNPCFSPCC